MERLEALNQGALVRLPEGQNRPSLLQISLQGQQGVS